MSNVRVHHMGHYVCEFKVPLNIVNDLNSDIDEHLIKKDLEPFNVNLAGSIEHEYNILNILREPLLNCFKDACVRYINYGSDWNNRKYLINMVACWFNDQKENEYNPAHTHHGKNLLEGLSAVMFLRVPDAIKTAKSVNPREPAKDGRLEFISTMNNMFTTYNKVIDPQVGDLFIFPYGLTHTVYPFKGEGVRRSLSFNVDLTLQSK